MSIAFASEKKTKRPIRKKFLTFGTPQILRPEINEVVRTLKSGWLGTGPKTHLFEDKFKRYAKAKYAVGLNSCTAGMHLALNVLGVKKGDEVITTPMTFPATANVIVHCGATPIFVDIIKETFNIDPEQIKKAITPKTKAIMPVHMCGRPCQMDKIMQLARQYKLYVIEDAAHALEARYQNRKIGSIGDITSFSFYVTKNVVTGEGGMITTNNQEWAEEIRIRSLHGISKDAWNRYSEKGFQPYETIYPGYKYNMIDIQAALGIHQLDRVERNLKIREELWQLYNKGFKDVLEISLPLEEENIRHARHLYTILLSIERLKINRNQFIQALKRENIGTGIHFTALHFHQYYRKNFGYKKGDFPNAEFVSDRTISLPLSPTLRKKDLDDVVKAVKKIIIRYQK